MKFVCVLLAVAALACTTLEDVRVVNRSKLVKLQTGLTRAEVLGVMGTEAIKVHDEVADRINNPYRTEMFESGGHRFEILYYYTDLKARDGAITDDELTPLVLKDGSLDGWGWSYLRDVAQKYEIRIR